MVRPAFLASVQYTYVNREEALGILRRRHKFQTRRLALLLLKEDISQPVGADGKPFSLLTDFVVLTKAAAHIAVGEKDGSGSGFPT